MAYLKNELNIARFDLLDASNHSTGQPLEGKVNATRAALADGSKKRIAPKDWDGVRAAKLKKKQHLTA